MSVRGRSTSVYTNLHKSVVSYRVKLFLILSAWTIALSSCSTHNDCSMIRASEVEFLITASFLNQSEPNSTPATVNITEYTVVCLAQGGEQDTWRFVSLVALYTYNGTNLTTSQFQFECVESNWTATVNGVDEYIRTDTPDANISTALRTDCALCIDPRQAMAASNPHHCLACNESCSEGLQRCTSPSQDSCCNYFHENQCVANCPNFSVSSDNFTCVCPSGFNGTQCELDINECTSTVCLNGVCENLNGSYRCTCDLGYTGADCDVNVDDCSTEPCSNNGVCIDDVASFSCNCTDGWTGSVCDVCVLEGCSECVVRQDSTAVCVSCQRGYSLAVSSGQVQCETVSELSLGGLGSGEIAGIVVAVVVGLALVIALTILTVSVVYLYKRRRRLSSRFVQNNVKTDQESSANVLKNPVFEADEDVSSRISIESDEHFAVNKAALAFEENND